MKSSGVRVASCGLNSTSSVCSRARATPLRVSARTWASGHLEHVLHVLRAGRDEDVDAGPVGVAKRIPAAVDVGELRPGQPADGRGVGPVADRAGDGLHGLEVALAGHREPGLDVVDTHPGQLLGDLELLGHVERDARRLLAVAQRRVEDDEMFLAPEPVAATGEVGSCLFRFVVHCHRPRSSSSPSVPLACCPHPRPSIALSTGPALVRVGPRRNPLALRLRGRVGERDVALAVR